MITVHAVVPPSGRDPNTEVSTVTVARVSGTTHRGVSGGLVTPKASPTIAVGILKARPKIMVTFVAASPEVPVRIRTMQWTTLIVVRNISTEMAGVVASKTITFLCDTVPRSRTVARERQ